MSKIFQNKRAIGLSVLCSLLTLNAVAQIPAGYYQSIVGQTGDGLKNELHKIIRNHKRFTYADVKQFIVETDDDPDVTGNIILFYSGRSENATDIGIEGDDWNREHIWAKSHGFPDEQDTAYTDFHHLRPADASVNLNRSNKDFNFVEHITENMEGEALNTYTDQYFWEPRDEIKGDVARMMFYMDARYNSSYFDLSLVDRQTYTGDPEFGVIYTLLQWNESDPVDQSEIDRNNAVYIKQQNRNPFIDHPEYVQAIWGSNTGPNLFLNTESFNTNFGMVTLGESKTQVYSLNSYNLEGDVEMSVVAPFQLSLDGVAWSQTITITKGSDGSQTNAIYLKFSPDAEGTEYEADVLHSTLNGQIKKLKVSGQEGELTLMTIAQAREKALGGPVFVTGIVVDKQNNNADSRVIYDGTAGIVVRSFDSENESAPLVFGDSIVVSGILGDYNNLLQISESPITINVIKTGASVPEFQELSIGEIGESEESELVLIKNVWFDEAGSTFAGGGSAGNFTITGGNNSMTLRIGSVSHPLVGTEVPYGIYNVAGFVGQFDDEYQISPRSLDDLIFVKDDTLSLIPISEARKRGLGERVKVTGVVIGGENNSADNRVIYDGTSGIMVRSFDPGNESKLLVQGDSVVVTGNLGDYNGLLQISESPISIKVISQNKSLPDPIVLTIDEIGEQYESQLVSLERIHFDGPGVFEGGQEVVIVDETGELNLRIGLEVHPLVGTTMTDGTYDVTGIIGQFGSEYQISPRDADDLELVEGTVTNNEDDLHSDVVVFPNPVKGKIYINGTEGVTEYSVRLTDMTGKEILILNDNIKSIDLTYLPRGIYLLSVIYNQNSQIIKIIKQ